MPELTAKRVYDVCLAGVGLLGLSPLLLLLAAAVKLSDGGPVWYRQQRVGRAGRLFWIWKYRTMVVNADRLGLNVTSGNDPRITRLGRWLRRFKLDELPQLWNVFRGDMSLVGPRPEVPRYVARYTPPQRQILRFRPGITDLATLEFRNEEALLRDAPDVEQFYLEHCLPRKIELNLRYAQQANLWRDTGLILKTLLACGRPAPPSGLASARSRRLEPSA